MAEEVEVEVEVEPQFVRSLKNLGARSKASELPDLVAKLYGIDKATPDEDPYFVFLVGVPGAGKSMGHRALVESGLFSDENYATLNLDILLESLVPFRATSALSHAIRTFLGKDYPKSKDIRKYASITGYSSKSPNVGALDFFNSEITKIKLLRALAFKLSRLERISVLDAARKIYKMFKKFRDLIVKLVPERTVVTSLLDLHKEAIAAAIKKRVNIVYETVFSNIDKFDKLYAPLIAAGYKIIIIYIKDKPENISTKISARQEYGMPYGKYPYYRFVPSSLEAVNKQVSTLDSVIKQIKTKISVGVYDSELLHIETVKPKFDAAKLPAPVDMSFFDEIMNIMKAYDVEEFTPSPSSKSNENSPSNNLDSVDSAGDAGDAAAGAGVRRNTRRGGARKHRYTRRAN
jgi:hypothetical protein